MKIHFYKYETILNEKHITIWSPLENLHALSILSADSQNVSRLSKGTLLFQF